MTIYELLAQILLAAWGIVLPFGFTFGVFLLFIWSFPLIVKFIKSIF